MANVFVMVGLLKGGNKMENRYLIKGFHPFEGIIPCGVWDTEEEAINMAWEWKMKNPIDTITVFDKETNRTIWSSLSYPYSTWKE